jgi:hypothetical protein
VRNLLGLSSRNSSHEYDQGVSKHLWPAKFERLRDFEISGRRSHGGAETIRKQREEATARHKGNWRVPCFCLCVKDPWLPTAHRQVFCTAPVIHPVRVHKYIPGRQVNTAMGSIPYRMCDVCKKKSLEYKVHWGLVDKIPPGRLRVEELGYSCAGSICTPFGSERRRSKLTTGGASHLAPYPARPCP